MIAVQNISLVLNEVDPSRTTGLRRAFSIAITRRFNELVKAIKTAIVTEDVFGLISDNQNPIVTILQNITTPGRRAFQYRRDPQKIQAFMEWLRRAIEDGILDVTDIGQIGESINAAWPNAFIHEGYKKGVERARQQLKDAGYVVPTIQQSGGIAAVLAQVIHADRVGVLYTRAFNELRGITTAMDQLISRILSTGIIEGQSPRIIAKTLVHAITGSGSTLDLPVSYINPRTGKLINYVIPARERAITLARTEIIRAHAVGQLQEFKNWGVAGVAVKAEFRTAGDDRVCFQCSSYEGNVYTLEEATSIIPVHPKCRCIWLPVSVN